MEVEISSDYRRYNYIPLYTGSSPEHQCLRILHLQPSLYVDAPLRFYLETVELQSAEDTYEAISYTWGAPIFSSRIYHASGETFLPITDSLATVLRTFRLPQETRKLWADAICINQEDEQEKALQIPLMRDIFYKA